MDKEILLKNIRELSTLPQWKYVKEHYFDVQLNNLADIRKISIQHPENYIDGEESIQENFFAKLIAVKYLESMLNYIEKSTMTTPSTNKRFK